MNGAEALLTAIGANDVRVCFANPGTSEMHLVASLDRHPEIRCVLGLFEGVCTGAADGYGRMSDRPAATLLHLGPGLANGLSNLHNALRAQSPIVNIVGDHATTHRALDAPLTSDVEGAARPFSHWVRTVQSSASIESDSIAAVAAALSAPGRVATLIAPADATWKEVPDLRGRPGEARLLASAAAKVSDSAVEAAARALSSGASTALILNGLALREDALRTAGRIAEATGAKLLFPTHAARISRGAGRVEAQRIPYIVDQAEIFLGEFSNLILVGAKAPVAFFGYPDKSGRLYRSETRILELAGESDDLPGALEALADRLQASRHKEIAASLSLPARPTGEITRDKIGTLVGAMLPEGAIMVDESITTGRAFLSATRTAQPHDWLMGTGGAIGYALPAAIGAAIACPGRRVIVLESDGSGMYMPQSLWTMARESLDVLVLIFANRQYQILQLELKNMGVTRVGPVAERLLQIGDPTLDWVSLAKGFGIPARRASTMEEIAKGMEAALAERGPQLIEVAL